MKNHNLFLAVVANCVQKLNLCFRSVRAAEGSALKALKEKLFTHRSELMSGFQQHQNNAGVPLSLCSPHL